MDLSRVKWRSWGENEPNTLYEILKVSMKICLNTR